MNRPIVVKVGGGADIALDCVIADVAALVLEGGPCVLVHGGAQELDVISAALGHPPRFVTSPGGHTSRRTDRETLEIFEMVYCGKINKKIVETFTRRGVRAVGLSGLDGGIWQGRRKDRIRVIEDGKVKVLHDDYTGTVERVNVALLEQLLHERYLPVLCPPALSHGGEAINVDGDRAAAATAAALNAPTLIILTGVPGLLEDFPDETSLIRTFPADRIHHHMSVAQGRMKKKLLGAAEAIAGGVTRVVIGDGRLDHPVKRALAGNGTVIDA